MKTENTMPLFDENDEFERMLADFISSEFEESMNNGKPAAENEDNAEEEDVSEEALGGSNPFDDLLLPSGDVEQNANITVKVEILRPLANPREELDRLVGCDDIKRRMDELVALTSYNKTMRRLFPESRQHAVSLHSQNDHDPGRLVIQMLMSILADESQRDIAVVLCGYKEPMEKLLELNPGLQSRFPNRFEFHDFTVDELLEITRCRVKDYEYQFTDQAWEKYRQMLMQAWQVRDPQTWGNARFVANQLERIYIRHAARCVRQQPADKQGWRTLTLEDIVPIEVPRQRAKIGF